MVENHSNPEAEKFRAEIGDEIKFKQASIKVEFLQHLLDTHKEFTQVQKNVLSAELQDAQRDLALLQQQLNNKYGVRN